MALPTFGARNLKHLAKAKTSGTVSVCDYSVCAHVPQTSNKPPVYGLCFRRNGEPKTCNPVYLRISPLEAAEATDARNAEEEVRRNTETVRGIDSTPCLDSSSQESSEHSNVFLM